MTIVVGEICMSHADLDALPLLDSEIIAELREIMEGEFSELIQMFLNDLPLQIDHLHNAAAQNNDEKIYQIAHKLKSSCGNLGALRLAEAMARLEQMGRQKALNDAADLLQRVQSITEKTRISFQALLDQ